MKADPESPLLAIRCELVSIQRRLDQREREGSAAAGDRPVAIAVVAERPPAPPSPAPPRRRLRAR